MPFYRDHIYPRLVSALGDPKAIQEVRQRMIPLAQGEVLEIGVGPPRWQRPQPGRCLD